MPVIVRGRSVFNRDTGKLEFRSKNAVTAKKAASIRNMAHAVKVGKLKKLPPKSRGKSSHGSSHGSSHLEGQLRRASSKFASLGKKGSKHKTIEEAKNSIIRRRFKRAA